jgi:hypothetical protein
MPLSEIAQALVRRGVITRDAASEAEQRKKLYGGGLDTALLELRATDEETLTSHLAEIIGIPLASPNTLASDRTGRRAPGWTAPPRRSWGPRHGPSRVMFSTCWSGQNTITMPWWPGPNSARCSSSRRWCARCASAPMSVRCTTFPCRRAICRCWRNWSARRSARVAGDSARDMRTPTPVVVAGVDPVETLLAAARLGDPSARRTALRRLSRRVHDPRVIAFRRALEKKAAGRSHHRRRAPARPGRIARQERGPGHRRDSGSRDLPDVAAAAHAALVALTARMWA